MATRVPARLSARDGRRFGLQVGIAFVVLGAISGWRGHPISLRVLCGIGAALILSGLLIPARLGPIYRGWMGLALLISRVTSPVLSGVVYFLVLTPIALLMRLFGHRTLSAPRGASVWHDRDPAQGLRSDMTRQF